MPQTKSHSGLVIGPLKLIHHFRKTLYYSQCYNESFSPLGSTVAFLTSW